MKRRTFVERSALTSFGIVLSPGILGACKKEVVLLESDFKGKVIIIGAGAAGLYAGFLLKSKGIDFTIIEASGGVGGRLGKKEDFADYPIDLGAQWLHGKKSIAGDLVKSSGAKITRDNSNEVAWFNNELTTNVPQDVADMISPDAGLPDLSFREYAEQQGLGEEYAYLVEQLAGDFGADSSELSIKWTGVEEEGWSSGDKDYKFEKTFFDLIYENIGEPIKDSILLNTPIHTINYEEDTVVLTDDLGSTYVGDKVIVTVPITILQDEDILFQPPLPTAKLEAFNKIGMGAGMKVFLKFSSKFYDENIGGGSVCASYADETTGKSGDDHVLLAFVMGDQAASLTDLGSDEAITAALLTELDTMYGNQASPAFIASHVENWTTNPYVRGAYSYSKVGIGNARSIATQSVNNKLFFAGEAMNINGHHQTVHGAMETAYREVVNILTL